MAAWERTSSTVTPVAVSVVGLKGVDKLGKAGKVGNTTIQGRYYAALQCDEDGQAKGYRQSERLRQCPTENRASIKLLEEQLQ